MGNFKSCTVLAMLMLMLMLILMSAVNASGEQREQVGWIPTTTRSLCKASSIAECLPEDDEFQLDSESSRRILATSSYISYGALQRNSVPCSRRGASYYNCRPGAQANPYTRGCSAITRCRGN